MLLLCNNSMCLLFHVIFWLIRSCVFYSWWCQRVIQSKLEGTSHGIGADPFFFFHPFSPFFPPLKSSCEVWDSTISPQLQGRGRCLSLMVFGAWLSWILVCGWQCTPADHYKASSPVKKWQPVTTFGGDQNIWSPCSSKLDGTRDGTHPTGPIQWLWLWIQPDLFWHFVKVPPFRWAYFSSDKGVCTVSV